VVALCRLESLSARYPDFALEAVDLSLSGGELCAVVGPNGAGKSTLLHAIAGLAPNVSGTIHVSDQNLAELSRRERAQWVSLVLQGLTVPPSLEVFELVLMARYPKLPFLRGPDESDRAIANAALATVDCEQFAKRRFGELSGGERQRVLLARCLAQETPLILLDEPTSSLDPKHKLAVLSHMRAQLEDGTRAILWVTHDMNLASQFADTIVIVAGGRIVARGEPARVFVRDVLGPVYGEGLRFGEIETADGRVRPWVLPWS